jgi:hypothetical protein
VRKDKESDLFIPYRDDIKRPLFESEFSAHAENEKQVLAALIELLKRMPLQGG